MQTAKAMKAMMTVMVKKAMKAMEAKRVSIISKVNAADAVVLWGSTGFVAVGGKTQQGKAIYVKAKAILAAKA